MAFDPQFKYFYFLAIAIEVIPPVSVSTSNLSMDEAQQTQICFDVAAAPTSTLTFDFALTGNASPHFNNYTTQAISFPAGSTDAQCITLATDPLDDLQSPNTSYVFDIQNIVNGELSANSSVTVEVIDQTPAPPPLVSFITGNLDLDEGASTEICLGLSAAPTETASVEVVLPGNKSPHFDDFNTITVSFPAGSTANQCFTLNTDPVDEIQSEDGTYVFALQNSSGLDLGTADQITIGLIDQTQLVLPTLAFVSSSSNLLAGESIEVCLSISEAPTTEASVDIVLTGEGQPHFNNFTTTTISFPIGNANNQCFTLNSIAGTAASEPITYDFQLQNVSAAQIGVPAELAVTVADQSTANCPYAGDDRTICQGETINIGCAPDPADPSPYCFKWEPEIGFVEEFGSTQQYPLVEPEETTTYTLYVTDGNGSLIAEEEVLVTVSGEMPQVEILMCEASPVQLTVIVEGESNLTYEWDNGSTESSIQAAFSGTYSVTVTNESSCQAIASIEVPEVLDPAQNANKIKEYFKNKGFFVLPIEITGDDDLPVLINSPNPNARNSDPGIIDHAEKLIKVKEEESFNVASVIYEFLQDEFYTDFADRKAYITKNENFCESVSETDNTRLIDETETNFLREEFAYWIHVWENPEEGGKDCLLIAAMSPNVEGISPTNSSKVDYLTNLLGIIEGESTTYGYASKGKQMLSVAFDNLADFYEADLTMDFLDQGQGTPTDPDDPLGGGPCGVQVTSELVCLNSAGFPITIPVGYTPYWAKPENLRGNFDPKALVAFSGNDGYYVGYKGTNRQTGQTYHTGFKNQKAPNNKYTFPDLSNECRAIYFGTVMDFPAIGQESCSNINANPEAYKTTLNLTGNTERTGIHQADFEAIKDVSNSNCDISNATSYAYNSCIPHISKAAFDKAKHTAVFNPFGANSSLKGGILFRYEIKETIGNEEVVTGEKWIFGHFKGLEAQDFTYFIWSCEQGRWQDYTPVEDSEVEDMPFLAALFGAMLETFDPDTWRDLEIGSQAWHTALDALGFFPVIGSVADFINGVWYISEGNLLEGIPTLVGAIPLGGDFYQLVRLGIGDASKYALKVNINGVETVLDSKSLGRYKCLTSTGFNSTNLSINSAISSFLFFPPDCNGTNSFKNNFDPSGLLSKAAKEGATELTEAATKELIDWLAIAVKEDVFIGKAFEKYPDLIKVWKQADFSAFPDENKRELLSWLGKMDAAKADEWAVVDKFLEKPELARAWKLLISKISWRRNTEYLTKVSRYTDEGLDIVEEGGQIIVKQADGVKVGHLDIDVSDGNSLKVLGENSGRHFDPDLAGGIIIKKSWSNPTITTEGVANIQAHVSRFGTNDANDFMIDRLNQIKNGQRVPDDFDKRFYTHELEEYQRYKNLGYETSVPSDPDVAHTLWNNTHSASLETYSVNERTLPLYPPEAPQ